MGDRKPNTRSVFVGLGIAVAFLSWSARVTTAAGDGPRDPGVRGGPPGAGAAIPGLTPGQLASFEEGREAFEEANFVTNPPADGDAGLGPRFNSDSCGSCHAAPAIGGTSPTVNPQIAVATKMGARNRIPSFLRQDGPVREVRFKLNADGSKDGGVHNLFVITGRTDAAGCDIRQEDFSNTSNLAFRIPTPTFGLGLVEAVADTTLRRNLASDSNAKSSLGISGRLNANDNDGTVTRFGHKAQVKSLHIFSGEAYNVEQGVSNHLFPQERDETPGCVFNPTPEDAIDFDGGESDDLPLFAAFMRFLAPPQRRPTTSSIDDGFDAFRDVGCQWCHTPALQTGRNSVAALNNKTVPLFSDLALHNMGPGLADDIEQGRSTGDEFRTAPLWGLGQRIFFLHDGRTKDLLEAIRAHASSGNRRYDGSEANGVIERFNRLSSTRQQNLLNFLRSL